MPKSKYDLIIRAQKGDEDAFTQLYTNYYKSIYLMALKITNCEADAQDAAQETFIEIKKSLHLLREPSAFYTWICRIVVSKCHLIFRRNKTVTMDPYYVQRLDGYSEYRSYMIPEKENNIKDEKKILLHMIEKLSYEYREILTLLYFCEFSQSEVTKILDIPLGTVKSRSKYAKEALKKQIKIFERENGRKLSFHVVPLPLLISTALSMKSGLFLQSLYCTKIFITDKANTLTSFMKTSVVNTATVACVSVVVVSGAGLSVDHLKSNNSPPPSPISSRAIVSETHTISSDFTPVTYDELEVVNNLQAYYALLNFAKDPQELQNKTMNELNSIKSIAEELKRNNSAYYDQLVNMGWYSNYESLLQTKI